MQGLYYLRVEGKAISLPRLRHPLVLIRCWLLLPPALRWPSVSWNFADCLPVTGTCSTGRLRRRRPWLTNPRDFQDGRNFHTWPAGNGRPQFRLPDGEPHAAAWYRAGHYTDEQPARVFKCCLYQHTSPIPFLTCFLLLTVASQGSFQYVFDECRRRYSRPEDCGPAQTTRITGRTQRHIPAGSPTQAGNGVINSYVPDLNTAPRDGN